MDEAAQQSPAATSAATAATAVTAVTAVTAASSTSSTAAATVGVDGAAEARFVLLQKRCAGLGIRCVAEGLNFKCV